MGQRDTAWEANLEGWLETFVPRRWRPFLQAESSGRREKQCEQLRWERR